MERFFKRNRSQESGGNEGQSSRGIGSNNVLEPSSTPSNPQPNRPPSQPSSSIPSTPITIDLNDLPWDPADRKKIIDYHPNQRDEIRRLYWIRGPHQPRGHIFPSRLMGSKNRRFVTTWFDEFSTWLEYSIKVDKAFCLPCYLFKEDFGNQGGGDAFVTTGYDTWSKKQGLTQHTGKINSAHNMAVEKCEFLVKANQSISSAIRKITNAEKKDYRIRLMASIVVIRYLLHNMLPFRGHDESERSFYKGLFLETLNLIASQNEEIDRCIKNAPKNCKMVSPSVQKDIVDCFATEVLKIIFEELGDGPFALLVDESSDVSGKEQMAVVLRYVNKQGVLKESFIGVVHVMETSSATLKAAIDSLFAKHGLSMKQMRGQGYDGAANMRGQFNGLKALILRENESAYYDGPSVTWSTAKIPRRLPP